MAGCGGSFIGCPSLPLMPQPQGSPLTPSALRSAPVNTASTPGMARAAPVSVDLISACACGERTKTLATIAGRWISATYLPPPDRHRRSSLRRGAAPIPITLAVAEYLLTAERVGVRQQILPSSQCIVNCPKHRWSLSDRFSGGCGAAPIDFKSLRFAPRTMSPSARRRYRDCLHFQRCPLTRKFRDLESGAGGGATTLTTLSRTSR